MVTKIYRMEDLSPWGESEITQYSYSENERPLTREIARVYRDKTGHIHYRPGMNEYIKEYEDLMECRRHG